LGQGEPLEDSIIADVFGSPDLAIDPDAGSGMARCKPSLTSNWRRIDSLQAQQENPKHQLEADLTRSSI
jgi:hypothetical protein